MSTDLSSQAAKSATHSAKRSRILYDVNPQASFIPAVDPAIMASSIARRKRRIQPGTTQGIGKPGSGNALALVTDQGTGVSPGTHAISGSNNSRALTRTDNDVGTAPGEPKAGGILVVRSMNFYGYMFYFPCRHS